MAIQQYVLAGDGNGQYQVVVHFVTPVGNNAVGISWAAAIVGAGLNTTILAVGTGAGNINSADAALIANGSLIEVVGNIADPINNADAVAKLAALTVQLVNDAKAKLQIKLKYFGYAAGVAS